MAHRPRGDDADVLPIPQPQPQQQQAVRPCGCKGIRRCAVCHPSSAAADTAPAQRPEWGTFGAAPTPLESPTADQAAGATTASEPPQPTRWLCLECGKLVHTRRPVASVRCCEDHDGPELVLSEQPPHGLWLVQDFVTPDDEKALVDSIAEPAADGAPASQHEQLRWVPSQSGRRKCEVGPAANFKKRKAKASPEFLANGMPRAFRPLLRRVAGVLGAHESAAECGGEFLPVEVSALDYRPETAANLDPHVDDEWIWGARVAGVCLLSDTVMTFVERQRGIECSTVRPAWNSKGTAGAADNAEGSGTSAPVAPPAEFRVLLPRRSLFVMHGPVRHAWLHGIAARDVPERRISITVRELAVGFEAEHPELSAAVKEATRRSLAPPPPPSSSSSSTPREGD